MVNVGSEWGTRSYFSNLCTLQHDNSSCIDNNVCLIHTSKPPVIFLIQHRIRLNICLPYRTTRCHT